MTARTRSPRLIGVLLICGLGVVGPLEAGGEERLPGKVGIFDLNQILTEVDPEVTVIPEDPLKGKEAEEIRKEIRQRMVELEKAGRLSEAKREKREAEISNLRKQLMKLRGARTETVKRSRKDAEKQIVAAVAEYADQKGFVLLFEKGYWSEGDQKHAVVVTGSAIDITQEVIQQLKAKDASGPKPPQGQRRKKE